MTTLSQTWCTKCRKALLAGVALSTLLTPPYALAAEREGTVLFFSMEDLQQVLSSPSLPSLASLFSRAQPSPSFWQEQPEAAEQDGPLERNARYGNGLGIDGDRLPGTRPPWIY